MHMTMEEKKSDTTRHYFIERRKTERGYKDFCKHTDTICDKEGDCRCCNIPLWKILEERWKK